MRRNEDAMIPFVKGIFAVAVLAVLAGCAALSDDTAAADVVDHTLKQERGTVTKKDLIVLVHGFCKGAEDMQFWKEYLSSERAEIITPDLPTTHSSFEECVEKLIRDIEVAQPEKYENLYFAGHSMGGLMLREYLQRKKPANARRLVCVGTPHYGSKLADIALWIPFAGMIYKPLHALKCSARKTLTTPEINGLEIGVIASTNNGHWQGRLFLSKEADGLVDKTSALAPDAKCSAFCNVAHVPMMFDAETAELIRRFLLNGNFEAK